jgi:hypothetical protein
LVKLLKYKNKTKIILNFLNKEQQVSPFKDIYDTNEQTTKDYIAAQLLERQELETLQYNDYTKDSEISVKTPTRPKFSSNSFLKK